MALSGFHKFVVALLHGFHRLLIWAHGFPGKISRGCDCHELPSPCVFTKLQHMCYNSLGSVHNVCTYMYIYVYIYVYICIYTYMYIYIY